MSVNILHNSYFFTFQNLSELYKHIKTKEATVKISKAQEITKIAHPYPLIAPPFLHVLGKILCLFSTLDTLPSQVYELCL